MAGVPLELNPEERSFFDAGERMDAAAVVVPGPADRALEGRRMPGAHDGRRRSRRRLTRRLRRKIRDGRWGMTLLSAILVVAAVWGGFKASMKVANQDIPDPASLGIEGRGH